MIEEKINDLISRMIELGFEYENENSDGVYFDVFGYHGTLRLEDWDEVESYVVNHTEND